MYIDSKKRYGCTKIRYVLLKKGYPKISVNRVSRLMKQLNIRSITIKKFKHYRQKFSNTASYQNSVNQNLIVEKPNHIWLSDITYIHTARNGWTYLASILDVCTRKIVGFSYGRKMDKHLVISALEKPWNEAFLQQKGMPF
ncbi:MAG: DDE-type integrase/transposase/recombinase [Oscillospiraceae bacterium]